MRRSSPVDGFSLAYDRAGAGLPVLLLHGWPGARTDFRALAPMLTADMDVVVPDLRGFGDSDKHPLEPAQAYSAAAQARSVLGLIDELGLERVVLVGYDIGSRVAQTLAQDAPDRVRALVLAPPLPGAGDRVLAAEAQREFWYQAFHQLALADQLLDGRPDAVRAYLRHFWDHWSGPGFRLADEDLERLVVQYGESGAFTASIGWYRASSGTVARSLTEQAPPPSHRIAVPTRVLWPEQDPLFPVAWSDRLDQYFAHVTVTVLAGCGHFSPLQAPRDVAAAIRDIDSAADVAAARPRRSG
jgi:pimeloyl-ACP methyl ester carboxylesterase